MDYWVECVECSFDAHGVKATPDQTILVAKDIESGHDMYAEANGHDVFSRNLQGAKDSEISELQAKLQQEREKVTCRACAGTGRIIEAWMGRTSNSQCDKCNGNGRHAP